MDMNAVFFFIINTFIQQGFFKLIKSHSKDDL